MQNPTFALRAAKEAIDGSHEMPLAASYDIERRVWSSLFGTHDQREGLATLLENREPDVEQQ